MSSWASDVYFHQAANSNNSGKLRTFTFNLFKKVKQFELDNDGYLSHCEVIEDD